MEHLAQTKDSNTQVSHMGSTGLDNVIHCDIKPNDSIMGIGKHSNQANMIDFGLAKHHNLKTHLHIPYRENKDLAGIVCGTFDNTHCQTAQMHPGSSKPPMHTLIPGDCQRHSYNLQEALGMPVEPAYNKVHQEIYMCFPCTTHLTLGGDEDEWDY